MSVENACERIRYYASSWHVLEITGQVNLEATRGVRDYKLNFWDAQLWAAARLNQIPVILSEDFNDGHVLEGVRFVNPFRPSFQLSDWL